MGQRKDGLWTGRSLPRDRAFFDRRKIEEVVAPCGHVEVETAGAEFVAGAIVDGGGQKIREAEGSAGEQLKFDGEIALALGRAVICNGQGAATVVIMP